ncbi:hypothetical protein [Capnocytophaga sputigena]|jgi:hypothetical protein|uniref:hypothetical protein n=1 Tax=Capnocytophaga sputigena TaxID=1019 RepID=UPI0028EEB391|nr:hypothetical protein [Capnocytophaga sputigena]
MAKTVLQIAIDEEDLPIFESLFEKFEVETSDIVYSLIKEDLQTVSNEVLNRDLTTEEVTLLESKIGDYIDWYDSIENAIQELIPYENN